MRQLGLTHFEDMTEGDYKEAKRYLQEKAL